MAFPKPLAAQDDTTAVSAASSNAAGAKSARIYYSYLRSRWGFGYHDCAIKEIRNVPVVVRDVPVHPDDLGTADSSWAKPIGDATVKPPSDYMFLFDFNTGPGASFKNGLIMAELGAGANFVLSYVERKERNYLGGSPNDSSGYERGWGAALTWYGVVPAIHGDYMAIKPYLFAEARAMLSKKIGIAAGYRVYKDDLTAKNGWDRYDSYDIYKTFDFIDLVTGMPYVAVNFSLGSYETRSGTHSSLCYEDMSCIYLSLYAGFRHLISKRIHGVAKGADFILNSPAWAFGVSLNMARPHNAGESD